MIKLNNKVLSIVVNIFLVLIWQLPQTITAVIALAVFHNYEWYYNEEAKITVLKVNKGNFNGNACFSSGPIIFVTPNCHKEIIKHETGHSWQSIILGPLFHIVISIPSIILFIYKRIKNKSAKFYHTHYPENWADKLGHVDTSKLF